MTPKESLLELLAERARRKETRLLDKLFPDVDAWGLDPETGTPVITYHAREKYQRHLEFFRAGASYRERCFLAANRVGKTLSGGGYETALHATGLYPHWWEGRRFHRPVRFWVAGKAADTTRDIVQTTLLGEVRGDGQNRSFTGTGVLPKDHHGKLTWKAGSVTNCVDTIKVRHVSGGWSTIGFKAYSQGRGSFEGTAQDGIWFDEEPPADVYGEALIRTATTNGIVLLTFTPLTGVSEVVQGFLGENLELMDGSGRTS